MFMTRKQITKIIEKAVDELIEKQKELLALDATERSLAHHLANYLAKRFPCDLNVDVEYNRHGSDPKRLNLPHREALDYELRATTVFPDIIVHKRGTNSHNILVIELKKPGESIDYDGRKLKAFRGELKYQHAAHLILGRNSGRDVERKIIFVP